MKITKILTKSLAKAYQKWNLNSAEGYLEYYESMARVPRKRVEVIEEIRRLEGGWN